MSAPQEPHQTTSWHAARAVQGDEHSVSWLVERLTPLLLAQARLRMGPALSRRIDPEDVVQEAWGLALPKLHRVRPRHEKWAGPLLSYLGAILRHRILEHARQLARAARQGPAAAAPPSAVPDATPGQITRLTQDEHRAMVLAAIENLPDLDRQIVVYRGIEQLSQAETGELVGCQPNAVGVRYHRALKRLRAELPNSVFDELDD